jgi:hypothetical protein
MVTVVARAAALGAMLLVRGAHPMHTTLTELRYDVQTTVAELSIRVFADDVAAATGADGSAARYVASRVGVVGRDGKPAALEPCGERRSGDLAWYCLRTRMPGGLSGARLTNALLLERFSDQVNIVQVTNGARRTTLLFLKNAAERTL